MTIQNEATSPSDVTIKQVSVEVEDAATYTAELTVPSMPQALPKNSTIQLKCYWNWEPYKGRTVRITVSTSQGFTLSSFPKVLPT